MKLFDILIAIVVALITQLLLNAQTFNRDAANIINQTSTDVNYAGAAWIDFDNDGDLDLHATKNHLFVNNGDGTFIYDNSTIQANNPGNANGVSWADYNNDGILDFAIAGSPVFLFKGEGSSFERITNTVFDPANDYRGWAPAWGDYNNDGFIDLVVTHAVGFHNGGNNPTFLFMNNGDGRFTRIEDYEFTQNLAPYTIPTWTDYDQDGDLDLFIGSGPAGSSARDYIYINQLVETGSVDFVRLEDGPLGTDLQDGQTYNTIDYDNDGDFDIFLTNYGGAPDRFYINDNGTYVSTATTFTVTGSNLANNWGDTDNDGDLDLLVTSENGNSFYRNNGDGTFTKITDNGISPTGATRGASFGDYDDDGDLDLFISGNSLGRGLYINELNNGNNWIKFTLEGTVSNRAAIGAKVKVKSTIDGNETWQIRELLAQNSFGAHNSLVVHFGLKDASVIEQAIIEWPSGQTTELSNLTVNETHNVIETIPSGFTRVNFSADIIESFGETTVQFEDLTFTDPADPITSWEWDFNNDGTIDATDQNPQWTYSDVGIYTVKLTVTNSSGSKELTREDYIEVKLEPGIPVIVSSSPESSDTLIARNGSVAFSVSAEDPTGYELNFAWIKNGISASINSTYNYRSSFVFPTPRIDTVTVTVSNPVNSISKTWFVNVVQDPTSVEDESIPTEYSLAQNYPNPFNPSTTIKYTIPKQSQVTLKLFDVLGNEIASLVDEQKSIGTYSVDFNADQFSSGIYFYSLRAGNFSAVKKMTLIK